MADERRGGKRAPISGVKVTYEGATGARVDAEVLDLASGGLFIRTDSPLAAGKRIALDLSIVGEPGPWSALGRVIWSRPTAEPGRPAGMGVKLIDVDDATLEAIERLVDTREPTAPGVGGEPSSRRPPSLKPAPIVVPPAAPDRERTLLGVGTGSEPPPPLAPSPTPSPVTASSGTPAPDAVTEPIHLRPPPPPQAPPAPSHPEREQSVAIDLVTAKKEALPPAAPVAPPPISIAPKADSGGSARWLVVVLLVIVAAIAAYVLFDGFLKPMGR